MVMICAPRVEWGLVEELLCDLSEGGVIYGNEWMARVMGVDERNVVRYKHEGVPEAIAEGLLERVNRGVHYAQTNPPPRGTISHRKSFRHVVVERVEYSVVKPLLEARLGVKFKIKDAAALLGVGTHTFYDWRRPIGHLRNGHQRYPGFPVHLLIEKLGVTREELGLEVGDE